MKTSNKLFAVLMSAILAITVLAPITSAAAATGSLTSVTASSSYVNIYGSLSVEITSNTQTEIDVVFTLDATPTSVVVKTDTDRTYSGTSITSLGNDKYQIENVILPAPKTYYGTTIYSSAVFTAKYNTDSEECSLGSLSVNTSFSGYSGYDGNANLSDLTLELSKPATVSVGEAITLNALLAYYGNYNYYNYNYNYNYGYNYGYGYNTPITGIPVTFTTNAPTTDVTLSALSIQSATFKATKAGTYYVTLTVPSGYRIVSSSGIVGNIGGGTIGSLPSQYAIPLGGIYYFYNPNNGTYLTSNGWVYYGYPNNTAYRLVTEIGLSAMYWPAGYGVNSSYYYNDPYYYGYSYQGYYGEYTARARTFTIVVTEPVGTTPAGSSTSGDIVIDDGGIATFKSGAQVGKMLKSTVSGYDADFRKTMNFSGKWVVILAPKNDANYVKVSSGSVSAWVPAAYVDISTTTLPADGELKTVTATSYASLRKTAKSNGTRLEKVDDGSSVIAFDATSGSFTQVMYNGTIGWILTSQLY